MLKEAQNKVTIQGILVENKLEEADYVARDGSTKHCIRGSLVVRTEIEINKEKKPVELEVRFFSNKFKNDGNPNKIYQNLEKVMNEYKSVAAVGEEEADYIKIDGGKIEMNEYVSQNTHEVVSFPRISGLFVNKITNKQNYQPEASFEVVFVVANQAEPEIDKDGNETGAYKLVGILPQYGGKVDVVPFKAVSPNTIDVISSYWQPGDTVKAIGKLNFSVETETVTQEIDVDFGEPQVKTYTNTHRVSDLIIIGGKQDPLDEEFAYDASEISEALANRKARLDEMKKQAESTVKTKSTPPKKADGSFDFGF